MRVLYVLRYYPTLSETFVYREMGALAARGHEVCAVALGPRADGALQDEPPPVVVRVAPRGARGVLALPALGRLLARDRGRRALAPLAHLRPRERARAAWVVDVARSLAPDRVHAHFAGEAAEVARAASAALGVPWSVTAHAADLFVPRPTLAGLLRDARPAVAVSAHGARRIREVAGVEAPIVRCGPDPSRYAPADPGGPGPLRVVSVARPAPKKGLDLLAAAFSADPPGRLRLVSDAAALAGPAIEVGALPPSAIPGELARAHIFALPCRVAPDGDVDGVPVALMEALAAGLPVLTTPVGGIPELVDEEVGWLVPPDDLPALREALRRAAADPAERARRGARGPARLAARGYTLDAQVGGLLAAWGEG